MLWVVALVAVVVLTAGAALWRSLTLFHVSIRGGEALVVYGRIPITLLSELREVARLAKIERATIKAVKDNGEARIVCTGLDPSAAQRVRNVCGAFPIAKLRNARPIESPTLGQRLGIAWLAWHQRR
jgi:hypothetical protein